MAGERHGHGMLCVNPPYYCHQNQVIRKMEVTF
jgi:hypothetical protein